MSRKQWWVTLPIVLIVGIALYNVLFIAQTPSPGQQSYQRHCANCHGDSGEGVRQLIPPLYQSDYARKHLDSLPCWVMRGMSHAIVVNGKRYEQNMYPIPAITDVELTNVMNYLNAHFLGGSSGKYRSEEVARMRKACR